jgi:hypothetical protein
MRSFDGGVSHYLAETAHAAEAQVGQILLQFLVLLLELLHLSLHLPALDGQTVVGLLQPAILLLQGQLLFL